MNQKEWEEIKRREAIREQTLIAAKKTIENNWLYFYERMKSSPSSLKKVAYTQMIDAFNAGLELGAKIEKGDL